MLWLRLFAGIICALVFLLGVLFSLSNQETIVVKLLPFAFIVEAPIYLVLLIVLFIGVVLGGVCAWVSGAGARRRVRQQAPSRTNGLYEDRPTGTGTWSFRTIWGEDRRLKLYAGCLVPTGPAICYLSQQGRKPILPAWGCWSSTVS